MNSTSISLLEQLRSPKAELAWQRFVDLYGPMIFYWSRQRGLGIDDAKDLLQDVLKTLVVQLQTFQYAPQLRFRSWLKTIVVNRALNFLRRNRLTPQTGHDLSLFSIAVENDDFLSETEYRGQLARRAMLMLKSDVGEQVWQAAWLQLVEGAKAHEVAQRLNISRNAVYLAKSRVLARLRQELDGLLD